MIKIGIVGAGGYAGVTLYQILLRHPEAKVIWLMSEEAHKGKKISELYPHLAGEQDPIIGTLADIDNQMGKVDLVFLALPHGIAMDYAPKLLAAGKKVIDLGADFRFNHPDTFKYWYQMEHKAKGALQEAVFGLPEYYREKIKKARLIGNPGCYPTASTLGAAPLLKAGLIEPEIIVDAKSGVSGAGRAGSLKTHYCERNEGIEAYAVTNHRHMGEIEDQAIRISGDQGIRVTFVPHLTPMTRGILTTIYGKLKDQSSKIKTKELIDLYKETYKNEPFVRIRENVLPNTKFVAGTNYCDIGVQVNERTGQVIVLSAIDNLIKGAAGQAVQNMNIMYDLEETMGLKHIALYP
ncbi:MAG: N-acetyl-gamma-glutamyl-phosphate reductase [Candidatus Margulisbacteria bacterium]|nr:N-acetyl-gamma-glutamyl-phosphate reductase [Candidatus Margulisiibacteriota bacterium]